MDRTHDPEKLGLRNGLAEHYDSEAVNNNKPIDKT